MNLRCKACRVTFNGTRYFIARDGQVFPTEFLPSSQPGQTGSWRLESAVDRELAQQVRREAQRQRRNRSARERADVLRSLGMTRTAFGWE